MKLATLRARLSESVPLSVAADPRRSSRDGRPRPGACPPCDTGGATSSATAANSAGAPLRAVVRTRAPVEGLPEVSDDALLALWSAGRDTYDIALAVGLPEAVVANRLPHIRERRRQGTRKCAESAPR